MDDRMAENAENRAAGRELARRLPWWTVWYGEYTGRFWAVPRGGELSAAPHIEAVTAEELEGTARHIERAFTEWKEGSHPNVPAGEAHPPDSRTGQARSSDAPTGKTPHPDSLTRKARPSRDAQSGPDEPYDPPAGDPAWGRRPRRPR
ncbi:hypothetical protein [Streptosporangium sp. CA-115845]|uniref:hypothetical protein n=1 Tax=Streptosporangium sp. CA-115845 TaxID=3240071 RepID=UPI003D8CAA41